MISRREERQVEPSWKRCSADPCVVVLFWRWLSPLARELLCLLREAMPKPLPAHVNLGQCLHFAEVLGLEPSIQAPGWILKQISRHCCGDAPPKAGLLKFQKALEASGNGFPPLMHNDVRRSRRPGMIPLSMVLFMWEVAGVLRVCWSLDCDFPSDPSGLWDFQTAVPCCSRSGRADCLEPSMALPGEWRNSGNARLTC